MLSTMHDPRYYADNDDGTEPHGYWIKSATYERDQQRVIEAKRAVREGRASWIAGPLGENDAPGAMPF